MYAALWMPSILVLCLVVLVTCSVWISRILEQPERAAGAPDFIQELTRAINIRTLTVWQSREDCVRFDSITLYAPRVGQCDFRNPGFATTMHFIEPGIRQTSEVAIGNSDRPTSKGRVIVLGDSYAMGWGVEDHETFASVLASEFGLQTLNLAVSSYGTARELLRLQVLGLLQPNDVIVIQYFENDASENMAYALNGKLGPYDLKRYEEIINSQPARTDALSIAANIVGLLWSDVTTSFNRLLMRRKSLPTMTPLQALLSVYDRFPIIHSHRTIVVPLSAPNRPNPLPVTQAAFGGRRLELATPILRADDYFVIDIHVNAKGHRAVAKTIATKLLEAIQEVE
jgi:lysophospholipase L1-like esterase